MKALLLDSLRRMRDAGQPLSALYTPHYSLYRRYGWEIAHRMISYAFPPKTTRTRMPAPAGRFRRVGPDDWRELDAIFAQHYATRNGAYARTELRWRQHVFSDYGAGQRDAAVWSNVAGEPRGYVVYRAVNRPSPTLPFPETILRVHDWVALDAEAYAGILAYLLSHDLAKQIVMLASPDEPLADALEEPVHLQEPPGAWFGPMLRLVDVQKAIEARPALAQASGKGVTVALTDASAPWNEGVWRIESREGRINV